MLLCGCGKAEEPENPYRIKTQIHETYHTDRTKTVRTEYHYDENGWLSELQAFDGDDWWYTTKFILDEKGNNHGSERNAADGTQTEEKGLTFDDQGRMLTSESSINGEVTATTEYGYGKDGQITKLYINRIGSLHEEDWKSFVDRTYDRKGRLIREDTRWEPHDDNTSYTLYHYEQDRLLRTETYKEETFDSYTDYTYDETGLIQTAISYEADGTLQSKRVTTFDEYGNQILQERYQDGEVYWRTENIYELVETTSERS